MHSDPTFQKLRQHIFGVAYRLLGSASDAEDLVQEAWLRWQGTDRTKIENPKAWLTTTVTRLAIDQIRSARHRRETYVGPWLPEPILTDTQTPLFGHQRPQTPEEQVQLADDISMALLVVLQQLAPEERAAFLLHDAFDYDYGDLATIFGKSEAACRQMVSRARKRIQSDTPRYQTDAASHEKLVAAFESALAAETPEQLVAIIAPDAIMFNDGGGKAIAALNPIYGPDRISRFFFGLRRKVKPGMVMRQRQINGLPGLILTDDETLYFAISFAISDGQIRQIYVVRNPDKLIHVTQPEAGRLH